MENCLTPYCFDNNSFFRVSSVATVTATEFHLCLLFWFFFCFLCQLSYNILTRAFHSLFLSSSTAQSTFICANYYHLHCFNYIKYHSNRILCFYSMIRFFVFFFVLFYGSSVSLILIEPILWPELLFFYIPT